MSEIPTRARTLVRERDGRCVVCGCIGPSMHVHHRQPRRVGGHALSNLVWLCDTDHRRAHAQPEWARGRGLIVSIHEPPTRVWLLTYRGYVLLDDEGDFTWRTPDEAP